MNVPEASRILRELANLLEKYDKTFELRCGHFFSTDEYSGTCGVWIHSAGGVRMRCSKIQAEHYCIRFQ